MTTGISLHIGLNRVDPNHYRDAYGNPWEGTLAACEYDAKDMQALAESQGFETQLLLSEEATADAVIGAIEEVAQALESGDFFLLTYAGHGGRVPDRNGEEEDDMDETWCCYDRQVVDDELYALWAEFQPGVRILMLSDSCHSGTVAKDPEAQNAAETQGNARVLPIEIQAATYRSHQSLYDELQTDNPSSEQSEIGASVILLSGCQDNQSSADGDKNGLFTEKLLKVWSGGEFEGDLQSFHQRILAEMPSYQTPNFFTTGTPSPEFEQQRPFTI